MVIVGKNSTTNASGEINTTLQVLEEYESYYNNREAGSTCEGQRAESIFVGTYDCSRLKVGMNIDVYYDKAVTTARGTYQSVKKIDIISTPKGE